MFDLIKQKFVEYLRGLGYTVGDSWVARGALPHINVRINGGSFRPLRAAHDSDLILTLDIFSDYHGEKEILQIVDNVNSHLLEFIDANPQVIYAAQISTHILEDKETGPVRKHGVISYSFTLAEGDEISG